MKIVDINEYMPVLIDLVNQGKDVRFTVTGSSMNPFLIHMRDSVIISKPVKPFKKGDIVFFQRENGQYVMHRIHHIKKGMLYIIGDNQTDMEGPVDPKQVFGIIHTVYRKDKKITEGDFWWVFFEKIWLHLIPFRHLIMKLYK